MPHSGTKSKQRVARVSYPGRRFLQPEQRAWLLDRIKSSPAKFLFIASPVPFTFHNGRSREKRDSWTGYGAERDLILDALRRRESPSVLLVGDIHNAAIRELTPSIVEVLGGSWSNSGFCELEAAVEELPKFPDAKILWMGPQISPDCDWIAYATLVSFDSREGIKFEMLNLASERVEFEHRLPTGN